MELGATGLWATEVAEDPRRKPREVKLVEELVVEMVVVVELGLAMLFTPKPLPGFEEDRLAGPVMVRVARLVVMEVVLSGAVVCIKG
jgi:hypothetical protein